MINCKASRHIIIDEVKLYTVILEFKRGKDSQAANLTAESCSVALSPVTDKYNAIV